MDYLKEHLYLSAMLNSISSLKSVTCNDDNTDIMQQHLATLASKYHISNDDTTKLLPFIEKASMLALGSDSKTTKSSTERIQLKKLIPATCFILRNKGNSRQTPSSLSINKEQIEYNDIPATVSDYQKLWESLNSEFDKLKSDNYRVTSESLLSLLKKYTSTIPFTQSTDTDISLYDYAKTSAALAVCLYDISKEEKQTDKPFVLIGADISGIQNYIYQIVSKYAARSLKGRSFYLRLLTDAVVRFLLDRLGLFKANIIYNSGGGFYLLAPNTKVVAERLEETIKEIENKMYYAHGLSLYIAIDSIEIEANELTSQGKRNLCDIWKELFDKKDVKKSNKLKNLISADYASFFNPYMTEGHGAVDVCTGEYFRVGEDLLKEGELYPIRKTTKEQIKLGKTLQDNQLMIVSTKELPLPSHITHIEPAALGIHYYFINHGDNIDLSKIQKQDENVSVVLFNDFDITQIQLGGNVIFDFDFYGGNRFECNKFNELCIKSKDGDFSRLGILRMDVDNLGNIFQYGLSERSTLSRMSALSRSFDYFFSGYLNTIWEETDKEHSVIIYSGGDDVFIVGDWSVTITLAECIHDDFKKFTCNNPAFSISGGITFINEKFPIIKGAELSAKEEDTAKEHKCGTQNKNSLSFFGMAMNFDKEYPFIKAVKNKIVDLIKNDESLPKSFISKLLGHWENADIKCHEINNIKTYWMLTYDLGRMKSRVKNKEARELIENCMSEICGKSHKFYRQEITTSYHPIELWAMACRWAELELRNN